MVTEPAAISPTGERPRRLVGTGLLLLAFVFLCLTRVQTISAPDFWSHLASGRALARHGTAAWRDMLSYTAEGQTIRAPGWLYDRALYGLWKAGGVVAVTAVHVLLVVGGAVLAWRSVSRWRVSPLAVAATILIVGWLGSGGAAVSPGVVSLFLIGFFFHELSWERSALRLVPTLLVAQWIWANSDIAFPLGPLFVLLCAVDYWLDRRGAGGMTADERTRWWTLLGLAAGLVVVSALHPAGLAVWSATLREWRSPPPLGFSFWISPIIPLTGLALYRNLLVATLLVGAVGLITYAQRLPVLLAGAALLGGLLALRSLQMLPIFAWLALPFLAVTLDSVFGEADRLLKGITGGSDRPARMAVGVLAALLVISGVLFALDFVYPSVGSLSRFGFGTEERPFPAVAAALMEQDGFPNRWLHLPGDGGYLAWRNPDRRIVCDLRRGVYDAELERQFSRWMVGEAGAFEALVRRLRPEALLLNCAWPGASRLAREARDSDWRLIYFDGITAVFLPRAGAASDFRPDPGIREMGLRRLEADVNGYRAQQRAGRRRLPPPAVLGGAELFSALDRAPESADLYTLLTEAWPKSGYLRLQLGIAECKAGRAERAIAALEASTTHDPENGLAWFWLAQAYAQAGRAEDARRASAQAERLLKPGAQGSR